MMPDRSTLWDFYLNGLKRNINSILAGVYGDAAHAPDANKLRGERSDELLVHMLQNETLGSVVLRLRAKQSRSLKQGTATLHDLALAHVLLSIALYTERKSGARPASTLASSMLMGELIADLRLAYRRLADHYPDRMMGELSAEQISAGLGAQHAIVIESIGSAIGREGRATHLAKLKDRMTPAYCLALFALAVEHGLDDRPFEDFLDHAGD